MSTATDQATAAMLAAIARKHMNVEALETRNSDGLDFYEVAVWEIKAALEAAFAAGRDSETPTDTHIG